MLFPFLWHITYSSAFAPNAQVMNSATSMRQRCQRECALRVLCAERVTMGCAVGVVVVSIMNSIVFLRVLPRAYVLSDKISGKLGDCKGKALFLFPLPINTPMLRAWNQQSIPSRFFLFSLSGYFSPRGENNFSSRREKRLLARINVSLREENMSPLCRLGVESRLF